MYQKQCTIYLKESEAVYSRQVCNNISWQSSSYAKNNGAIYSTTGNSDAIQVMVQIPMEEAELDNWSASQFGYIIKGIIDNEITDAASLKKFLKLKPFTITSVAKNDYSIFIGDHWEVYGK